MVTMGGDLQPGCLADRLLTGLGQPQITVPKLYHPAKIMFLRGAAKCGQKIK